jgi:hypothetical protein
MMGRSAEYPVALDGTADRGRDGFGAVTAAASASESITQELDESSLAALVNFFQLLDRWQREANSE